MKIQTNNYRKMVVFDWGGVIESHLDGEYNFYYAIKNIFKRLDVCLDDDQIIKLYNECSIDDNGSYISECDNVNDVKKWFERIKLKFSLKCDFLDFCKIYDEETSKILYYQDVVKFAHSLKKYCSIAILSNLNYLDKKRINLQVDLSKFDNVFLSFELKCKKPDFKIYKIVEQTSDVSPENILFIDDKLENIESARKRGWKTCQAYGYELDRIKEEVSNFLND